MPPLLEPFNPSSFLQEYAGVVVRCAFSLQNPPSTSRWETEITWSRSIAVQKTPTGTVRPVIRKCSYNTIGYHSVTRNRCCSNSKYLYFAAPVFQEARRHSALGTVSFLSKFCRSSPIFFMDLYISETMDGVIPYCAKKHR